MSTDHFSPVAEQYASFRPSYPNELFDWLVSVAPQHKQAWDCGAGSGQATAALAARFEQVLGTDISAAQLATAPKLNNIEYRVAPAEVSGLPDHSADLVTIAQAMHWFDLPAFYTEVRRVLKPQGVIAAWGYNRFLIGQPDLQKIFDNFYVDTIGPYWPAERVHVENEYRHLSFPFSRIQAPRFSLQKEWTREHLMGYMRSWSAVARYQAVNGSDPVAALEKEIRLHWPDGKSYWIEWPLFLHAGRVD
jgi:ubiquinone/menaquinone biosynthesis C-methylase UbiE